MESKGRRGLRAAPIGATPPAAGMTETSAVALKAVEDQAEAEAPIEITVSSQGIAAGRGSKSPPPTGFSEILTDVGRQNFAAFFDSQTALARGLETLSTEITGLALAGVDVAARTATDALSVKTITDAIEVNAGFTRRSFDALMVGSAKLSEAGFKVAAEAWHPLLTHFGKSWTGAACLALRRA
jgi:Phasin protein